MSLLEDMISDFKSTVDATVKVQTAKVEQLEADLSTATRIIAHLAQQAGCSVDIPSSVINTTDSDIITNSHHNIEKDCITITVKKRGETTVSFRDIINKDRDNKKD